MTFTREIDRRSAVRLAAAGALAAAAGTAVAGTARAEPGTVKALQLNLWLNGTKVRGGIAAAADAVQAVGADIVTLSEAASGTKALADELAKRGATYHAAPGDAGILSRTPLTAIGTLPGGFTKAETTVAGTTLVVYSAHLQYKWYATYLPRGYNSGADSGAYKGWDKIASGPVTDASVVLEENAASGRPEAIDGFVADAQKAVSAGKAVLLGGDFNEPPAADWTTETKDLFDHNGVVAPWQSASALQAAGFADAYRTVHPSPVTHPGFTWPASNTGTKSDGTPVAVGDLTWAKEADERDRIDYLFARGLSPVSASVVGPRESIVRSERRAETSSDEFVHADGAWPTDHKGVTATFRIG
ncbi:endonuclease/exonuclease/phosphatase family protein [Tsukamurella sp. 1534]|uniref:endonuclease/exonuclease/phosphatase family protein n=1 Tax=Tsukamurella sp. 1534 TaxID=1151061 RepID=UPI0003200424|nr:endonuclease/exonuclease/phosphatase family protein [Tsukamurella sp. 1534]